ncbi:oligosaccharide flippase family protein [Novosphingobium sp.]|uniref:oligosaccharide flippase family protein n=1 Tax=Novosphingobium sp. TaxID=1874826 RepID=UPI00334155A7
MTETAAPGPAEPAAMSIRGAALWAMAGQYLGFAIQFVSSVVVSRFFLSPAEVGLFSIALAAALMVSVFQDFGLTRYVTALHTLDPEEIRRCSSVAILSSWGTGALLVMAAPVLAILYHTPGLAPVLVTIAASYLVSPFSVVPYALLSRAMAFNRLFAVNIISVGAQALTVIGLAAAGYSAMSLAWGMLANALAKAVLTQCLYPALPFPLQFRGLSAVVRFGSQSSFLAAIGAAGSRSADLIVGKLLSLTATGIYSRSTGLATQLRSLVTGAIGSVLYPAFARMKRQGEALDEPYLRIVGSFTAGTWPTMAGLAVVAEPLVDALIGPRWSAVAPVLRLIAIGEMLFEAVPMQIDIPILYGAIGRLTFRNILDTLSSVVLLLIGASLSVEAAAASRIAYGAMWFGIYISFVCELIGLPLARLFPVYAKSAGATLAAVAPLLLARMLLPGFAHCGLITLGLLSVAGIVCWLVALKVLGHPLQDEIDGMRNRLTARRARQLA